MPSVRTQRLSFSYTDAVPLFEDVQVHLPEGWTGLVGANGAGKSTLLHLLAGTLVPTSGQVLLDPAGARIELCLQDVERPAGVEELAQAFDRSAQRLLGQLCLDPEGFARWPTLSPGERKRWQIGAALWREPDLLLLDEPTNHLDAEARAFLLEALRRFRGVGVVVSHDRDLLEALTSRTLRIHAGTVRLWPGSYEAARREWECEAEARATQRDQARDEQRRREQRLAQARREAQAASAQTSTRKRMRSRNDSDARTLGAQTRAEWAESRLSRGVEVLRRQAERGAEALESLAGPDPDLGRSVFVGFEPAPKPVLCTLAVPELRAGDTRVLGPLSLVVRREDRLHVAGPNGAGKTTLLHALLEAARLPPGKMLYLPQDLTAAEAEAVLSQVRALPPAEKGRVLSLVAALGVDPGRLLASSTPSPGEARKLLIARGLGTHVWMLALDEPTNHLDLPSVERLEAALSAYPGALLLVTHDEHFAKACTTRRLRLGQGRVDEE